jgi:hypothetical protein
MSIEISKIVEKQKIKKIENQKIISNNYLLIKGAFFECKNSSLILLKIKNNKLTVLNNNLNQNMHYRRAKYITTLIEETLINYEIQDIIFIVSLRDNLPELNIPYLGPIYEEGKSSLAIPNNWEEYFTESNNKVFTPEKFDIIVKDYNINTVSKKQNETIVFRGDNNCDLRRKVKKLAENQNFLDVEFAKKINDQNFIPYEKIISDYQYFFILRGNGPWTGTINQFSLANGVLFKVEEDSKQPIELFLEANIDYISIKNDLSDFEEKVLLSKVEKLMEKMKNNLKRKSDIFFKSENIMYYMYLCITNLYQ